VNQPSAMESWRLQLTARSASVSVRGLRGANICSGPPRHTRVRSGVEHPGGRVCSEANTPGDKENEEKACEELKLTRRGVQGAWDEINIGRRDVSDKVAAIEARGMDAALKEGADGRDRERQVGQAGGEDRRRSPGRR